ncbi:MAG: N-acetylmuramoyl-L-alanine amidase [Verrucomicrobiales bacterium]|jgi:N-acetylmuramoyl-L-alanine amidase
MKARTNRCRLLAVAFVTLVCLTGIAAAAKFNTVIIDAGHGGHDRGAGIGYTYEKHLAFDVARRLEKILKDQGIKTVMTRNRDEFISLTRRVAVANKYSRGIFVSVHFNSSSRTSASGLETYYSNNQSKSRTLALLVQSAAIFQTGFKDRGAKHARYHVLANNSRPSVLVECGFLTNSSERARTLSPNYRQKLAEGIAMGIIRYKNGK